MHVLLNNNLNSKLNSILPRDSNTPYILSIEKSVLNNSIYEAL